MLEMRLDALVSSGFARTIVQARQTVVHRHILVDGQLVDRPSQGQAGPDHPGQAEEPASMDPFQVAAAGAHRDVLAELPGYLEVELEKLDARSSCVAPSAPRSP